MINIKRLFLFSLFFTCFLIRNDISAQKINQFDENHKRTGIWKKYHSNKRIRYIGQFKNGKEIGVFKFYDITTSKHPIVIKTFFENSDSLKVQFYNLEGKLQTEGIARGKKRIGKWKYFNGNGTIMSEENYKNGKLHGAQLVYYPNGKTTETSLYREGRLEGVARKFSSKGILIEEVIYQNGKLNGLAKYFDLKGNLKEKGNYKEGMRVGKWEYYLDGEILTEKEVKEKNKFVKKKKE